MSIALIEGSFSATGQSDSVKIGGNFNFSLSGFGSATVSLERSFDNGSTWKIVESFTADAEKKGFEPELDTTYRVNCSDYASGTILYRVSR